MLLHDAKEFTSLWLAALRVVHAVRRNHIVLGFGDLLARTLSLRVDFGMSRLYNCRRGVRAVVAHGAMRTRDAHVRHQTHRRALVL